MKKSLFIAFFGVLFLVACNNTKKAEVTEEVAEPVVEEVVVEEVDSLAEMTDTVAMDEVEEVVAE